MPSTPTAHQPLVVNHNSNISHAPGGFIVNWNYNETHTLTRSDAPESMEVIEKCLGGHHVPGALHDAQPAGAGCMEGTRVQLLDRMKALLNIRGSTHIVWIAGMAGTGKTSIALTLCRTLINEPTIVLGGTFFCSRFAGTAERADVQCIIPTFAAILARSIPVYAEALAEELKDDPDLAHKSIRFQVERLLVKPFECLESFDRQVVFVVDALDECSDEKKLVELIDALADFNSAAPIKFLLTSRPEMHIRETSITDTSLSSIIHLHTIDPAHVTADIRLYIQKTFEQKTKTSVWYTEHDLDDLAILSGGLFIFASTALAYILRRKDTTGRLERMKTVQVQISSSAIAIAPLDKMYSLILTQASDPGAVEPTELDETRRIVAVILATRAPLTLKSLADVLGLTSEHLRGVLDGLHAVILVPEKDDEGELRTLHASFGDFIFTRAPEYIRISKGLGHDELARGCLERMTTDDLCFNISRSRSSYILSPKAKPHKIAASLIYASLHWAHHVDLASLGSSFATMIDFVLRSKLLFWLEVLSVVGEVGRASSLLRIAASAVTAEDTLQFLRDAISFVTSSHEAIEHSPAHIYLSALPFTPKNSLIFQSFSELFTGLPAIETFGIEHHAGRCVMVLAGHNGGVKRAAYSPDGKALASCSGDSTVQLWDIRSGVISHTHSVSVEEEIRCITFTPDGRCLVAVTKAGSVLRWDTRTSRLLSPLHRQHANGIQSVVMSSDGGTVASAFNDGTIEVWSTNTGHPMCGILSGHEGSVYVLSFSSDGKLLASGGYDAVGLWDCRLGKPAGEPLTGHRGVVVSLAFSLDGAFLASGYRDGLVRIWNTRTGILFYNCYGHRGWVHSVNFAPDDRFLASASHDCTVRVWNLCDGANLRSPLVLRGHSDAVNAVCFSNDGLNVASCSSDGTIRMWDVGGSHSTIQPIDAHTDCVNTVTFSGDSRLFASASNDGSVRVWNAHTCKQMYLPLLTDDKPVHAVAFSPNNHWIATGSYNAMVRLWDVRTGRLGRFKLHGHTGQINTVAFSPDSLNLASGSRDQTVRVWDMSRQSSQILQITCSCAVCSVAYSPNGELIAVGEAFGDARIFNAATGQQVRLLEGFNGLSYIMSPLVFSPDSTRILAPNGTTIVGRNIHTGYQDFHAETRTKLNAIAYSPNGLFVVSGADSQSIGLWDAKTAQAIRPNLHGHVGGVHSVGLSSDGRFLVTGGRDTTIRLWDLEKVISLATQRQQNALAALAFASYKNGWLLSARDEPLLWVPPEYRPYLEIADICKVIATCRVVITANDEVLHRGVQWDQCWRADNSSICHGWTYIT